MATRVGNHPSQLAATNNIKKLDINTDRNRTGKQQNKVQVHMCCMILTICPIMMFCLHMQLDVTCFCLYGRVFSSRPSWAKATDAYINSYQSALSSWLDNITLPHDALVCQDPFCCNAEHT